MEDVEADLRVRAERWAREDPDSQTRAELLALLSAPDLAKTDLAIRMLREKAQRTLKEYSRG